MFLTFVVKAETSLLFILFRYQVLEAERSIREALVKRQGEKEAPMFPASEVSYVRPDSGGQVRVQHLSSVAGAYELMTSSCCNDPRGPAKRCVCQFLLGVIRMIEVRRHTGYELEGAARLPA